MVQKGITMTVAQLLQAIITAGTVAGAISALGVVAHFAIIRPFRKFIRKEIVGNLVEIKDAVGGTARLDALTTRLDALATRVDEHLSNPNAT
jgi:hypothetical protein